MKKIWSVIAMILCAAVLMVACTSEKDIEKTDEKTDAVEEQKPEEKEYQKKLDAIEPSAYANADGIALEKGSYISVIGKGEEGEFWAEVKKGAEQAVEDINTKLGYKGKDAVKVTYSGPADTDDVDEQVNILDEELARYPIGISISIADMQACGVQFDLAAMNGIPIVAFDSGSDYPGLAATVSTDNVGAAALAADKIAELMGETGEVAVFTQDSKSQSAKDRVNSFVEAMQQKYPEITVVNIYASDQQDEIKKQIMEATGVENPDEITEEQMMDYIIEKYPNLKGCYATNNDTVIQVVEGLARAEAGDVKVVGYDYSEESVAALKNGEIDGLIVQNPFGMGYASVIASARASLNLGNEAYINTGYVWVTKENMKSEEVKGLLY